jgi:hypothetical protein
MLRGNYDLGDNALTPAETATINPAKSSRNKSTRKGKAVARQNGLVISCDTNAAKTPHTANSADPNKIRASAPRHLTKAAEGGKSGPKEYGSAKRSEIERLSKRQTFS